MWLGIAVFVGVVVGFLVATFFISGRPKKPSRRREVGALDAPVGYDPAAAPGPGVNTGTSVTGTGSWDPVDPESTDV
jgi:hypothetical protein